MCEGGPSLAAQLLNANLVDEVCLTTSPQVGAGALGVFADVTRHTDLGLLQLLVDESGYVFARWSTRDRAATAVIAAFHRSVS